MLAWIAIIVSFIGVLGVGVGSFLAYRNRDTVLSEGSYNWAFIITLGGLVTFFIGWIFFLVYLFFSKGLDLNMEARKALGGILPDPDLIRKEIVEGTDDKFTQFISS